MNVFNLVFEAGLLLCGLFTATQSAGDTEEALPPTRPLPDLPVYDLDDGTDTPCTTIDEARTGRNGRIDPKYLWTKFYIHPDKAYTKKEAQLINDAAWQISQVLPCIEFGIYPQNSTPSGDYIYIVKGTDNGCNTKTGRRGGKQELNLQSPGCMEMGKIMHEMIHALGFEHEQTRPDRDHFVTIHKKNIKKGHERNFVKFPKSRVTTYGVPYDLRSIMHYGPTVFSSNGKPTITAKGDPVGLGTTGELTESDQRKLKLMYNCTNK